MSQPAARLGDMCTGHDCYPPRPSISASSDTFIDGIPALRVGDKYEQHCCTTLPSSCHEGTVIVGSGTTFINGMAAARVGDALDCGSTIAVGSSSTFIG
jgi:uncharacterized Zn-binding protein involved in type VI secretion